MPAAAVLPSHSDVPDTVLVEALRRRDEGAFLTLVHRHNPLMLRVARGYLGRRELAEDAVQDTWMAVLRSIDLFEGRSSFKTWLMRILMNTARRRRLQESRSVCWSSASGDAGPWDTALRDTDDDGGGTAPERSVLAGEVWSVLREALGALPQRQRAVLVLRDVEGWSSNEVQNELRITPGNQRVLLHRARAQLRERLGPYCSQEPEFAGARDRLGA